MHEVFKHLHCVVCVGSGSHSDPLTLLPSRVKAARNVTKSAPSAILIIARINEGRELVSALRLRDVTN